MRRQDFRTKKQFKKDIKEAHLIERAILKRWFRVLEKAHGHPFEFSETGCGPDGEYLSQSEVTTAADYYVKDIGYVEVKFSKVPLEGFFHLKVAQIKSYIAQRANVLMVDAWNSPKATFTFITPEQLESFEERYPIVPFQGMGGKICYRLPTADFIWRNL